MARDLDNERSSGGKGSKEYYKEGRTEIVMRNECKDA